MSFSATTATGADSQLSDDGIKWLGIAALIQAPDPNAARTVLTAERYAGRYAEIEVHRWDFGGRPE